MSLKVRPDQIPLPLKMGLLRGFYHAESYKSCSDQFELSEILDAVKRGQNVMLDSWGESSNCMGWKSIPRLH